MPNYSMNRGEKLIFDADDPTNPNTTYASNPAGATDPNNNVTFTINTQNALRVKKDNLEVLPLGKPIVNLGAGDGAGASDEFRVWASTSNRKMLFHGGPSAPQMLSQFRVQATTSQLQGDVQILKYTPSGGGTAGGNLAVAGSNSAGSYKYETVQFKSLIVVPTSFVNFGDPGNGIGEDIVFWQGPGPGIQDYVRPRTLTGTYKTRCMIPVKLPNGATVSSMDMTYRKTFQGSSNLRNAKAYFYQSPAFGAFSAGSLTPGPEVTNADGTTTGATKSQSIGPVLIDNLTRAYGILLTIENNDVLNGGADGLGIGAFKINYQVLTLEVF